MLKARLIFILTLIAGISVCSAQAPQISYGPARFFALDSIIRPVFPENTGGAIPAKAYSQTRTYAGNGTPSKQDGRGTKAGFNHPSGLAAGKNGELFIADEKNNIIRKISPGGDVSTFARGFNSPTGIATDQNGNIYVADCFNHRICRITPSGNVSTIAGSGIAGDSDQANGLLARFRYPVCVAVDVQGNVYVSDEGNHKIRKISPRGAVTTLAGNGRPGDTDHVNGQLASFNQPFGLDVDESGNVFVADQLNHKIRKISPEGAVSTLAGTGFAGFANNPDPLQASFNNPRAVIVGKAGCLYVADPGTQLIRRIAVNGEVTTLAGSGASGALDNRKGVLASFFFPTALVEDSTGLYVADYLNNKIRKVETSGFEVEPATFPPGISFDPLSGKLSGTARVFSPGESYLVTAHNLEMH